jgi:hypothetical protein
MNLRRVLLWLHRWVGVVAGLVILVAAVTGALLVVERPVNRWLAPSLYPMNHHDGARAPVERALTSLRETSPDARVDGIHLPRDRRDALMLFAGPRVAHFDPSSGEMLGWRPRRTGFTQTLVKLHVSLLAGPVGGTVGERGQSRVLTQFKKSEKFGVWQDNCELNTLGRFTM